MKRPTITIILLLLSLIFITGCYNSKLITKDVKVTGFIYGIQCNGSGKCIESMAISPQDFSFDYSDWNKVKPYFNKNVSIKGDLISEITIYSCKDYNDGLQHPVNEACEIPGVKYYQSRTYIKVDSIEPID